MQEFNPLYLHPYKYNQWSKVPRGPVAAAVGSFLFGATSVATIAGISLGVTWGTIGGFLITTAIASWAMSALMPKPQGASGREGMLSNRREPVGSFDIVYGKVRKGGNITFMESTGSENKYLHFIITLAGHPVEAIEDIYINENIVELDTNGFVTANPWKSKVRIKKMLGGINQAAQPQLVAETSINANFRGRGIAYLYVRLEYDSDVFAEGIPNFTAVVKGKKVFDPRTNTTVWSDNAALCIRDYLRDPLGVNSAQSPNSLNGDCWVEGANVCDSLITKKDSSTEKRYTLNGVVPTANTPRENLQQMLTSCGGTLFWGQGQWQFKAGYFPSGPYVDLGMDDLRSGISLVTKNSRKENFNSVSGVFINSEKDWIETEYPRFSSSVFLAQDNGQENSLDMELPFTTSPSAAQRLAKMAMFRSREEIAISANFSLKAANVKVGDVVRFSFERYGFTNKYFEVLSWKLVSESDGLVINMTMKETSADAYDWSAEEKDIIGNNTILPQPREGLAVSGLVVTNRQTLQSDGTFLGEVLLSWNPAENAFVYRYDVQWRKNAETAWSSTQTTETEVVIPSVKSGISYIYRVRAVSVGGFVGAWEQIGAAVSGKDTPPGLPTNVQAKGLYRAVQVTWNNPTDRDLNHIEIYTNTSNSTTGATKVGESGGTKFIYDMEPMDSLWFFLRAVDHSGNKSAFTAGQQGTALFIEQSDVNIDIDQLLEDAGLNAVEVLPSLPTTGNYDGRTVYNTSDRQLHIYDEVSGTWKPAVEPFNPDDLILDKDNFPTDLKPVEVLSSLPTTGNFEGRVVMLLSDGKLYRYKDGAFTASVPTVDLTGQIVTDQIAANSISPSKLKTLPGANLLPDPLMEDADSWTPQHPTLWTREPGAWVYTGSPATQNQSSVYAQDIAVRPEYKYQGKVNVQMLTGTTAQVRATWQWLDVNKTVVSTQANPYTVLTNNTPIIDTAIRSPANANVRYLRFAINIRPIATDGTVRFSEVDVQQLINTDLIDAAAITAVKLADNAVTAVKIANDAVEASKIATGAVTGTKISDNAVTETKILDGSISTPKITTNAITSDKIVANAVTTAKIDALAITTGKIAAGAIVADKIQAGAVGADQIAANAIVASKIAIADISNLIMDSDLQDEAYWIKPSNVILGLNYGGAVAAAKSKGAFIVYPHANPSTETNIISETTPVKPGEEFFAKATIGATDAHVSRIFLQFLDKDLAGSIGAVFSSNYTSTSFGDVEVSGVAPANARYARLVLQVMPNGYASGHVVFSGPVLRRKNGGELIVDGAITAGKIAANSIDASKIVSNSITANEIAANTITANEIATNAITADEIATNAVTTDKLDANAVTAGKIAAGAIAADKIQAGAVTASKITIADITNLVNDDQLQDPDSWQSNQPFNLVTSGGSPLSDSVGRIIIQNNGETVVLYSAANSYFPVSEGQEFYVSWQISTNGTVNGLSAYGGLQFFDVNDAHISINNVGGEVTSGSFDRHSGVVVVPSGAVKARFRFQRGPVTGVGSVNLTGPTVRLRGTTELIVNGAITADKIASNSVTTDHLVANSVTAGIIAAGAVSAVAIQAGAVTAGKINVNNLAAINANLGAITGGSLNIGGKFIVNSAGNATIRSGTTGERLVITNNRIDVYDASGTLRVRVGQL